MRKLSLMLLLSLFIAACQPSTPTPELPTQVQFPTGTNTPEPTATSTETNTPEPSATATDTPTETPTASNTPTPTITLTPSQTVNATSAFRGTSTAFAIEAPRFATLTPLPAGAIAVIARPTSTGTPQVMADIVITRFQFQEEVNLLVASNPGLNRAQLSFVAERGINVELTADDNGVFVTGTVFVPFTFSGGSLNNILMIGGAMEITMPNEAEPSEEFIGRAIDAVSIVGEAFNNILNQRLGEGNHDLEFIVIQEEAILVSLLVPQP